MNDITNNTSNSYSTGHINKLFESDIEYLNPNKPSQLQAVQPHKRINIFQLQNEHMSLNVALEKMNEVNAMLSSQLNQLSHERHDLRKEIMSLQHQLNDSNGEINQLHQTIDSLHAEIDLCHQENNHLKNKLNEFALNNEELMEGIELYRKQIEQTQHEVNNLQNQTIQYENLNTEHMKLKTKLNNLKVKTEGNNINTIPIEGNGFVMQLEKENRKLKKNLTLFYKENHAAALHIKELEKRIEENDHNEKVNRKENTRLHQIVNELKEKINEMRIEVNDMKMINKYQMQPQQKRYHN